MRPQVVAHRGASHENAEHTLRAYQRAIEVGADALECDVRLTADGHLVCVHDRNLQRTAATKGVVSTMNLADLDELEAVVRRFKEDPLPGADQLAIEGAVPSDPRSNIGLSREIRSPRRRGHVRQS